MNELIRSSITGDIIKKNTIYSKYNSLKNRSITPNESITKNQKTKYVIDMEKQKNKNTHYKNNSFLIGNKNNKIKNFDTEVQLGNFNLQRNNSQLMANILKVGKTYYQMQKNAQKKQNKKVIRYNNESGTDTLANFEFSD
jgi:phosphate starvation-inducible protein PhoH